MTIASSTRKAGPFTGDGASTVFAFSFKVFSASDLYVVKAVASTSAETVLTLATDYTVSLNSDQDNSPGGTVTLASVLASGYTLTLTSSVGYLQPTDLTNQGGFYPRVINSALDRLTILTQQLNEQVQRCVRIPMSSPDGSQVPTAQQIRAAVQTTYDNVAKAQSAKTAAETARDQAAQTLANSDLASRIGTSGPASYRNKLGNCGFVVNQLGTSFTLQPGAYVPATADLWAVYNGTDKAITITISSDWWTVWDGRRINFLNITAQSPPTSGSVSISQRVENCDTLANSPACLSYLALNPSADVSVSASWTQNFGSGGSRPVSGYFYPVNTPVYAPVRYSATTYIPDIGSATKGAGDYWQITLDIPIRSTGPFFFGFPQLEKGTTPTPVEFVEDWVDRARCLQRYWRFSGAAMPGYLDTASSTSRFIHIPFPVPMRSWPSIVATGNYAWSVQALTNSFVTLSAAPGNSTTLATLGSLEVDARL